MHEAPLITTIALALGAALILGHVDHGIAEAEVARHNQRSHSSAWWDTCVNSSHTRDRAAMTARRLLHDSNGAMIRNEGGAVGRYL